MSSLPLTVTVTIQQRERVCRFALWLNHSQIPFWRVNLFSNYLWTGAPNGGPRRVLRETKSNRYVCCLFSDDTTLTIASHLPNNQERVPSARCTRGKCSIVCVIHISYPSSKHAFVRCGRNHIYFFLQSFCPNAQHHHKRVICSRIPIVNFNSFLSHAEIVSFLIVDMTNGLRRQLQSRSLTWRVQRTRSKIFNRRSRYCPNSILHTWQSVWIDRTLICIYWESFIRYHGSFLKGSRLWIIME